MKDRFEVHTTHGQRGLFICTGNTVVISKEEMSGKIVVQREGPVVKPVASEESGRPPQITGSLT